MIATLPLEESVWHRFDVVDRARAEFPNLPVTHVVATPVPAMLFRAMTIIAGFSSSRQGSAPLDLAAQPARTTGEKIIAAAVVERALPAGAATRSRTNTQGYVTSQATASLERVVDRVRGDLDIYRDGPQFDLHPQGFDGYGPAQRRSRGGRVLVFRSARHGRPR